MKSILLIVIGALALVCSYFLGQQSTVEVSEGMKFWFGFLCFVGTISGLFMLAIGMLEVFDD